jgi:hypothetical protein
MVCHKKTEAAAISGCKRKHGFGPLFLHVLWLLAACLLSVGMKEILAMKA